MPTILPENPSEYTLNTLFSVTGNLINWIISFAVATSIIALIYGSIQYFTGGSNEEKSSKGKNIILWAIVGLVVIMLSQVIIRQFLLTVDPAPVNVPEEAGFIKDVI